MAFIIPDNILETLICTFCHKYLSVKPIIVYPNRDVECGRCAATEQQKSHGAGVESVYGKMVDKWLFKCINRFDGCRELLTCSQVPDHEKVCLEKNHKCPICHEELKSFLMIQHFHSNHKDAILDCPAFVFNLNDHLGMLTVYIYQEEDNLFFLYISYNQLENTIELQLVYMGSEKIASNIYHQFTVYSENKEFDINCSAKSSCINEFSLVDVSNMSRLIFVKFKIAYQNLQFCAITDNVNSSSSSINHSFEKLKLGQGETNQTNKIIEFPSGYNLQCFNCKEICIYSFYASKTVDYYYSPMHNNILCFYCFQWLNHKNKIKEYHFYVKHTTPSNFRSRFCKWNCGRHFVYSEIVLHEIYCKKRIQYYNCPVQNCQIQNSALPLSDHLLIDHDCNSVTDHLLIEASFFPIFELPEECFVFVEDQIIYFQLTAQDEYNMECKIVTNDDKIQLQWKPHVLFFNNNTLSTLANLCINDKNIDCIAKIVLVKNE
ncbi:uncharacterized protein LOC114335749 [Diabrotica virgifera virgifera]|uniref:Uncharacterized protein LOC114335749 n=1 Tax=Diabrotica virgifera virgifera TaxID=50390 RepID=A0A6P7G497_DIAVI|nr:uncharacterized protein LOC114335749 [Diabrotica virgifera virgifera]